MNFEIICRFNTFRQSNGRQIARRGFVCSKLGDAVMRNQASIIVLAVLIAGVMVTLSVSCFGDDSGANNSQPHFQGEAPGASQTIIRKFEGVVSAMDTNSMTLTIKLAEGDRVFKVTPKTKFNRNAQPASMKDIAVGETVEAAVNVHGQRDEIIAVNIKSK